MESKFPDPGNFSESKNLQKSISPKSSQNVSRGVLCVPRPRNCVLEPRTDDFLSSTHCARHRVKLWRRAWGMGSILANFRNRKIFKTRFHRNYRRTPPECFYASTTSETCFRGISRCSLLSTQCCAFMRVPLEPSRCTTQAISRIIFSWYFCY